MPAMSGTLKQDDRVAEFSTPLGKDALVLVNFSGTEGLGELFEYHIEALGEEENIDFDKAIGQGCTVKIRHGDKSTRIFHGIMTDAQWGGQMDEYHHYRIVLRPWFWLLGRRADCRIFLDKNVKDIIREVFTKAGFTDFDFRTTGDYQNIEYCVQYRESDLTFVCRLMELYGIYYFFEPSEGKHTMVLADSRSSHKPFPDLATVKYNASPRGVQDQEQILRTWFSKRNFQTGKVHFNDYNYLQPKKDLKAPKEAAEGYTHSKLEVYDYPGKYDDKDKGEKLAQFRLEAEQALDHRRTSSGDAVAIYPGGLLTLNEHPTSAENREYLAVHASHQFTAQHYRSTPSAPGSGYTGSYTFQPSERPFRNLPRAPKPRIYGIQTAKVVGKKGEDTEEISTDEYGRIWVQFYWDREPQKTCPIRVAQSWAGNQWGTLFIPRIGMEVVVEFLEGDPDRPLVTGSVYNGDNKPPTTLPDKKTRTGWKSNSSKGGGGKNILVFEDKKDSEHIGLFAQKDLLIKVLNSETRDIGENFMTPMGSPSRDTTLEMGDDKLTLNMGNQNVDLQMGNQTITLDMGQQTVSALQGITLSVCMGLSTVIITPASISLTSPTINLTAEADINLTAPIINITGIVNLTGMLNITGGMTVDGMVPMLLPA
jgi:type VI secretion system secreted protein VgrG